MMTNLSGPNRWRWMECRKTQPTTANTRGPCQWQWMREDPATHNEQEKIQWWQMRENPVTDDEHQSTGKHRGVKQTKNMEDHIWWWWTHEHASNNSGEQCGQWTMQWGYSNKQGGLHCLVHSSQLLTDHIWQVWGYPLCHCLPALFMRSHENDTQGKETAPRSASAVGWSLQTGQLSIKDVIWGWTVVLWTVYHAFSYAFILTIGEEDICICVDGIIFMFDGIILQHVTSNLAIFTCLAHNYVIFWPQMQTNINTKV